MILRIKYNKLWKLLIDRNLKKGDLQKLAEISSSTITKLAKNETVTTDTLLKVCRALNCSLDDISELELEK